MDHGDSIGCLKLEIPKIPWVSRGFSWFLVASRGFSSQTKANIWIRFGSAVPRLEETNEWRDDSFKAITTKDAPGPSKGLTLEGR